MIKKLLLSIALGLFLLLPSATLARDPSAVTDWYIKDFRSEITINTDSSISVTELITADCGNLPDKHGIFRSLPTQYVENGTVRKTPVKLESITNFNDQPLKYSTEREFSKPVVTWKIGDANKTVTGENNYKIKYKVLNAVDTSDANFDRFHWNLLGNFWDLEIDSAKVIVKFPDGVFASNTKTEYYTGSLGSESHEYASVDWQRNNTISVASLKPLPIDTGVTLKLEMPKNIFKPYQPSLLDKYGQYLWLIIPLLVLAICFSTWKQYGDDPDQGETVVAEYDPPANLSPIKMAALIGNGSTNNRVISAEIIKLAVDKAIKIEEIPKKNFLSGQDFKITRLIDDVAVAKLPTLERKIVQGLFSDAIKGANLFKVYKKVKDSGTKESKGFKLGSLDDLTERVPINEEVKLSSLKNNFYMVVSDLKEEVKKELVQDEFFSAKGFKLQTIFIIIGLFITCAAFFIPFYFLSIVAGIAAFLTGIIMLIFGWLMPRLSEKGVETVRQIKGFRLFMETAEKYREQFNERENIFEKLLPYAIAFGIAELWAKKMKMIYGEEYFASYHPYWFVGNYNTFDVGSFTTSLNAVTSSISSTASSGGGGAGGGGGGGGGGGW